MATNDVASIGVGMDTSGVESGIKSLDVLAAQGPKVESAMAGVEASATKTGKSLKSMGEGSGKGLDEVTKSAPKAAESVWRLAKSAEDAKSAIAGINASVASLGKVSTAASQSARGMSGFNTSLQSSQKTLLDMQAQVRATSTAVAQMGAVLASSVASSQAASKAQSDAAKSAADMGVAFKAAGDQVRAYSTVSSGVSDVSEKTAKSMDTTASAARALTSALAVAGVSFGANEIISLVDGYTKFTAQLQLASKGASDYALAMESTKRIATDAQQGLGEVGTLYARIANGTAELGLSQKRLSDITETVALSLKVSGASASESSSAMLQLSQAFASGVLRGEEFNSVSEAAPRLMKALADGMGVPIGALRKMAEEGKLTAEVLSIALPKALEDVRVEAEKMQTIGGSFTVLRNSMMEFFGVTAQASGAVSGITKSVELLAENLNLVTAAALGFGAAKLGQLMIGAGVAAAKNAADTASYVVALNQQRTAAIASAQAESAVSAARVSGLSALQAKLTAERAAAIAEASSATTTAARTSALMAASVAELNLSRTSAQLTAATAAQTVAQTALTGAITATGTAATIASRALTLVGGPIGLITTALGLGVTAWMAWGNGAKDASDKAHGAVVSTHQDIMSSLDKQIAKLRERAGLLSVGEVGLAQDVSAESAQLASLNAQIEAIRAKGSKADAADQIVMIELQRQYENLNAKLKERANLQKEIAEAGVKSGSFEWLAIEDDKITKQFVERMEGYAKALNSGAISADAYRDSVNRLNKERYASTDAGKAEAAALKESTKGLKSGENSYASLAEKARDYVTSLNLEASQGAKLTQSQKLQIDLNNLLANSKIKVNSAAATSIQRSIDEAKSIEDMAKVMKRNVADYQRYLETQKEITDDLKKREDALNAARQAMSANEQTAQEQFDRLKLESSLIGASNAQRELALAQYDAELELKRQIKAIDEMDTVNGEADREELRRRAREIAAKKLAIAEGKIYVSEWDKTSQVIGQTLQDYIMGGGKDAATYLKRLFSTLVLQPIVQYGVQQLMGGSGAAAGATSGGQSGLIGGGMPGGSFTDWSTLGSKAGNWLIDQSTDLAVKGFGTLSKNAFALGDTIKSVDTWLKDIPGMSGGIGSALGYAGALVSLSQGQYGSAAGAAIGTAILPGIGTMIGSTLGGLVDGLFGSSRPKSRRLGGAFSTSELDDYQVSTQLGLTDDFKKAVESRSNETLDTAVQSLVVAVTGAYNSLGKYTGDRKIGATAAFADEPSLDDRYSWAAFQLFDELSGKVLAEWNSGKALDPEGEKAFAVLSGEMSAAMVAELKASDIPGWMRTVLDSLGSEITLDGLSGAMQQIAQIDAGFMSLGKTMGMFTDLSGEMQTALLNATGGLENLVSVSGSFYESYYTEAQRMETLSAQLKSALSGLNIQLDPRMGDAAKAQFKSTVEAAFAAGNGELAAQLLNMNQSFATAAEYAAKAAEEMQKSALAILENAASGALANLEAAVNREKTYWQNIADASQTAISSLSSALGLLTSNAQALYGEVSSTQQMMAAQGMVYVENALAGVRRGASVGSFGGLQDAISAARSGISSGAYATQFERERDALVLAGQLKELGGLTETQISVEERTLRAAREQIDQLDKTLEYWQQALDFDAFQIDATLSVAEAVAALGPLISAISLERSAGSYASAITAVTPGTEGQKVALYQQMIAAGLTDAQIRAQVDKTTGVQTDRDWDYLKRLSGIPSFDVGTNFVQRDMVANIHQGERIFTAVENRDIVNAMRGGSNNSALVSAVDRLTAQNAALTDRLEAIERNTSKMPQMADQIDSSGGAAGMFNVKVIA